MVTAKETISFSSGPGVGAEKIGSLSADINYISLNWHISSYKVQPILSCLAPS